jgi:hypothetical protein
VVAFFYNCNFGALMGALGVGSYTAAALQLLPFIYAFDGNVRSLTIAPGYMVTLFDLGNLSGPNITLTQDVPCLSAYNFNDVTSSLIIELGRAPPHQGTAAQYCRLST